MKSLIAGLAMLGLVAGTAAVVVDTAPASAGVVVHVGVGPAGHYRWNGHYYRYRWNGGYYNYYYGGRYYRSRYYCVKHRRRVWCYR